MTTPSEALSATWAEVAAEAQKRVGYYVRRIPLASVWPALAGIRHPDGARSLILETDINAVRSLELTGAPRGYDIDTSADDTGRADRTWIRIRETAQSDGEIFALFCADLLELWARQSSPAVALAELSRRLTCWGRFFQNSSQKGLSHERYVGLFGELSFIRNGLAADMDPLRIVTAWHAPEGSNQDFLFGPFAVEIKTVTANDSDTVRISNARQLDATALSALFLGRYAFDFRPDNGTTLPELVAELKASFLIVSPQAASVFGDRLLDAGFVEGTRHELDAWGFVVRRFDLFGVTEGFPRILEADLPAGLSAVSYDLNLAAAHSYLVAEPEFWPRLSVTNG